MTETWHNYMWSDNLHRKMANELYYKTCIETINFARPVFNKIYTQEQSGWWLHDGEIQ